MDEVASCHCCRLHGLPADVLGHVLGCMVLRDIYALRRTSKATLWCTAGAQALLTGHWELQLGVCSDNLATVVRDFPLVRQPPVLTGVMQLDCFATYVRAYQPSQLTIAPCNMSTAVFRSVVQHGVPACVGSLGLTVTFDNLCHLAHQEGDAVELNVETLLLSVRDGLPLELVLAWLLPRTRSLRYLVAYGAVNSMDALTKHLPLTLRRLELTCTNAVRKPLASFWALVELFELPLAELGLHHFADADEDVIVLEALRCAKRMPGRLCMTALSIEALCVCRDRACDACVTEHVFELDRYTNELVFYD